MNGLTIIHPGDILAQCEIDPRADFFTLSASQVSALLEFAKAEKYRAPKNRNGSKGRYYHVRLIRKLARIDREYGND